MMGNRKKQTITIIALVIAIITISIGFAAFSNTLTISSQATVTPDSGSFRVVFSKSTNSVVGGSVSPKRTPSNFSATGGYIGNSPAPTLTNLSATFRSPGQKVEYDLYVYNAGAYVANLNSVIFRRTKSCTPGDGTSASLVDSACSSITMTVKIGDDTYTGTTQNITGRSLAPGASQPVKVTLEYASNGVLADGPITVSFNDVALYYSTAVTNSPGSYTVVENNESICNGDKAISIGSENFCVMYEDSNSITMLTEKLVTIDLTNPRQSDTATNARFITSANPYWQNNSSYLPSPYGSDTYPYVYNSSSNLYKYVNAYGDYIEVLGVKVLEARLISYEELNSLGCNESDCSSAPAWVKSPNDYWTGTSLGIDENSAKRVWIEKTYNYLVSFTTSGSSKLRPVLKISKS